ncbi:MAG: LPS-assembly protein LptD [Zoogloeaceae bacterium]|jgi:LPS-assembly protein|nr:LPS-assembly protein LptD [Zoogloeaceae bacterium]
MRMTATEHRGQSAPRARSVFCPLSSVLWPPRRPLVLLIASLLASLTWEAALAAPDFPGQETREPEPSRLVPAMPVLALDIYRDHAVAAPLALRPSGALQSAQRQTEKPKAKSREKLPSFITADRITGQTDEVTHAEGHVELRTADSLAFADKLDYFPLEDEVEASGNVRLVQEGAEVSGPHMKMRMSEQIGHFDSARYRISRMVENNGNGSDPVSFADTPDISPRMSTAFGTAGQIHFEGENHFRLVDSTYSTCRPEEEDWYAKSAEIKLDYDLNEGEAKHAALYFKDTPILYAPYFSFPLNNQRKSGFLMPTYASSTRTGLDLAIPYYWNIAPNYDATIVPRVMSKRGLQLGTELRYLDHHIDSRLRLEYMDHDKQFSDSRYAYDLKYSQNLGGGFSTYVDWQGVSDDEYFTDLSSRVVQTAQRQLPRDFRLHYAGESFSASLHTLRYQTLNPSDENNHLEQPYFLQPQLSANMRRSLFGGKVDFDAAGQYTRFYHPDLEYGARTVLYPQLSLPYVRPGYYITPKVGLHFTRYQLNQRAAGLPDSLRRTLPIFSLDMGMTFERPATLLGHEWLQTLEPRLYYLDIPYKDQSRFPIFDTGLADFNFGQIFSENRFSGYDRINNARQLTAALTTRLIDPQTGAERVRAMVGQRHYFKDLKVGLPGEDLYRDKASNFLAAFSGQVWPKTYVDMALEYNFKHNLTQRSAISMRYQPAYGQTLSASYRYNQGITASLNSTAPMEQIDLAGQWRLGGRWYAVGRYNYSFDTSRLIEGIAGLEYSAGCWVARFAVQRLETTAGDPNTSIFFQLELNDFGQIGSNPIQMLRRGVPGYRKINELPESTPGSLLPYE